MSSLFASVPRPGALAAAALRTAPVIGALCLLAAPAKADKIANPVAVFDGLDKITGRIITFEVKLDETVQFGTLQVTPRICYSRPPTDPPRTDAFTQVDEIDEQHKFKRIFSGWMFADSPGLHGVEHPIYDVWLVDCKGGTTVIKEAPPVATATTETDNPDAATDANTPASPTVEPPPPPKRKPKPRPVIAAPLPAPEGDNAPLDLGGSPGNARGR
jgi:hypothetical protein